MTDQLIQKLRERANLFRAQVQPGSNIFDQVADTIGTLQKANVKLQEELRATRELLNTLGDREIANIPGEVVEVSDANFELVPLKRGSHA